MDAIYCQENIDRAVSKCDCQNHLPNILNLVLRLLNGYLLLFRFYRTLITRKKKYLFSKITRRVLIDIVFSFCRLSLFRTEKMFCSVNFIFNANRGALRRCIQIKSNSLLVFRAKKKKLLVIAITTMTRG